MSKFNIKKIVAGLVGAVIIGAILSLVFGGGAASAARLITGHDIKNHSIQGRDLGYNSVNSNQIQDWSIQPYDLSPAILGQIGTTQNDVEILQREVKELQKQLYELQHPAS